MRERGEGEEMVWECEREEKVLEREGEERVWE